MNDQNLLALAQQARDCAYAPYSKFHVGAALLSSSGKVYTGCNVENVSFGATICAERTAFVKAISEEERSFEKIMIVTSAKQFILPCGICRQFMAEFSKDLIILVSNNHEIQSFGLSELLPNAFLTF